MPEGVKIAFSIKNGRFWLSEIVSGLPKVISGLPKVIPGLAKVSSGLPNFIFGLPKIATGEPPAKAAHLTAFVSYPSKTAVAAA